jgi:hypothetical protein
VYTYGADVYYDAAKTRGGTISTLGCKQIGVRTNAANKTVKITMDQFLQYNR